MTTLMAPKREIVAKPASPGERFRYQLGLLEKGLEALQANIGRLDEILFKIQAGGVTLWVALMGWAFSADLEKLVPLGSVVVIGSWLLAAYFRGLQARSLASTSAIIALLNDADHLDRCFETETLPHGLVYPLVLPETQTYKLRFYLKGIISPSVATIYLFLGLVNLLLVLAVGT